MAQTQFLEFGPWAPDRSEFNTKGTEQALNVIRTSNGYRPFDGLADTGFAPLPDGQPTGLFFGKDVDGNARQFAAVFNDDFSTGIYELDVGGASWVRVGTVSITSAQRFWDVQFDDTLFVTNFSESLRRMVLASGSAFQKIAYVTDDKNYRGLYAVGTSYVVDDQIHFVSSSAPEEYRLYTCTGNTTQNPDDDAGNWNNTSNFVKPKFLAIVRDFLVGCFLEDPVDGLVPNRVRWPAIGDPLVWSLNGNPTNLSDFQDVPDVGECRGIVGGEFGTVLFENGVVRMDFIGPPAVFSFNRIENARGCSEPNSIVTEGQNTYFLSDDGWSKFDGQTVTPIGAERFDRWFGDVSQISTRQNMTAKVDPQNTLLIFGFDSGRDATDINDTALLYDYVLDEPSYAEFSHSLLGDFVSPGFDMEDVTSLVITDPTNYIGVWSASVDYDSGDRVSHLSQIWNADVDPAIGSEPGQAPGDWTAFTNAPNYKGPWQTNGIYNRNGVIADYAIGDRVAHVQKIWEAVDGTPFVPTQEPGTGTSWQDNSATEIAASIDDLTTSLDGLFYKAGAANFGALRTNQLHTFTGIPNPAQIDTSEQRLGGEKRAKVQMVQTAIEGIAQQITVQIGVRNRLGVGVKFGPERELNPDGQYPVLQDSRYQRIRVNITSTDIDGWGDATGVFVQAQPTSLR